MFSSPSAYIISFTISLCSLHSVTLHPQLIWPLQHSLLTLVILLIPSVESLLIHSSTHKTHLPFQTQRSNEPRLYSLP